MQVVIDFMNRLTDMDWGWWPMLSARPPKDRDIDSVVVLKITPVFGTAVALVAILPTLGSLSPTRLAIILVVCWVAFFAAYRATFAVAWNARARSLRAIGSQQAKAADE